MLKSSHWPFTTSSVSKQGHMICKISSFFTTSSNNHAAHIVLCICPVNRTKLLLYVYITTYWGLNWRNLCVFLLHMLFKGVCVTRWSTALSICAMESLSVQISFPNSSLETQWNKWAHAVWGGDGSYVSSQRCMNCCDVIRFFFFKGMKRNFSCCITSYCKSWMKPARSSI